LKFRDSDTSLTADLVGEMPGGLNYTIRSTTQQMAAPHPLFICYQKYYFESWPSELALDLVSATQSSRSSGKNSK
jgi:hypothetical protein